MQTVITTIENRINELRKKAGIHIHNMNITEKLGFSYETMNLYDKIESKI